MSQTSEALERILHQPFAYLHAERGGLPALFSAPAARALLDQALVRGLGLSAEPLTLPAHSWAEAWVRHWRRLPAVARLMGAQLGWAQLAIGARLRELDEPTRTFARLRLGERCASPIRDADGVLETLDALGLNALLAWHAHIPPALIQRLPLQFSPRTVALQQAMPAQRPNASLFVLAVQHARLHQNPD
jgi:type III secretion system OrgA/MxiK family protein